MGVLIMYETKAFWGKESNQNINTMNCTMNFMNSFNLIPVVVIIVVGLIVVMFLTTCRGFG